MDTKEIRELLSELQQELEDEEQGVPDGWVFLNDKGEQVGYHASPARPDDRPGWRAFVIYTPPPPSVSKP